jgi:hypothetical protein
MIKQLFIVALALGSFACTSDDVVDTSTSDVAVTAPGAYDGVETLEYSSFPDRNSSEDALINVTYVGKNDLNLIGQGGDAFRATTSGSNSSSPSLSSVISGQGIYEGENQKVEGNFRLAVTASNSVSDTTGTLTYTFTRNFEEGGTLTIEFNGVRQ